MRSGVDPNLWIQSNGYIGLHQSTARYGKVHWSPLEVLVRPIYSSLQIHHWRLHEQQPSGGSLKLEAMSIGEYTIIFVNDHYEQYVIYYPEINTF